jgi:hypothetical protein
MLQVLDCCSSHFDLACAGSILLSQQERSLGQAAHLFAIGSIAYGGCAAQDLGYGPVRRFQIRRDLHRGMLGSRPFLTRSRLLRAGAQTAASGLASKAACRAGRDCLVLRSLLCLADALAFRIKLSSSHRVAGRGSFVLARPNYRGRDERSASSALLGLDCSGFESSFRLRSVLPSAT